MKSIFSKIFSSILCFPLTKTYAQSGQPPVHAAPNEISFKPKQVSPRRATLMSAVLPGLGQAYNKDYWKIPIIYAGVGIISYLLIDYNQQFILWRDRYIIQRTAIENGLEPPVFNPNTNEPYSLDNLDLRKDTYRRYRDMNVILLGLLYALNIAEANVAAHLSSYEISKDLSIKIQPQLTPMPLVLPCVGLSVRLTLK